MNNSINRLIEEAEKFQKTTGGIDIDKMLGISEIQKQIDEQAEWIRKATGGIDIDKMLGISEIQKQIDEQAEWIRKATGGIDIDKMLRISEIQKQIDEQAEWIRKATGGIDIDKMLGISEIQKHTEIYLIANEAMKNFKSLNPVDEISFPKIKSLDFPQLNKIPTFEETNSFQSAGALLRTLANSIEQWRTQLPENVQPAIIAILQGGIQIEVDTLAEENFNGIRIEGKLQGSPCVIFAHQGTVQLLCYIQPLTPPEKPKRPIGFVIHGDTFEV